MECNAKLFAQVEFPVTSTIAWQRQYILTMVCRQPNYLRKCSSSDLLKDRMSLNQTAKCCDCCKSFLVTSDKFRSTATNKVFRILLHVLRPMWCILHNVVYLAQCVDCNLQGVGSSINLKKRLVNYKSYTKRKCRTCGVVNHFLDCHGAGHSTLKFMLIDQSLDLDPSARKEGETDLAHLQCFESDLLFWQELC
jgi:hypothetical protein